eukprot:CAMPEP_0197249942 /NCGR_PEP_ID=MMETSP1429-20130617/50244_1 /TAXON_ID=49237 /ORGANISM="Chaetoceros  sp., Strain UNC1202" /LENGTH=44 /DNA_ID= /DNA_START= /DNA_END= /DNA_ORIENTATION=
MNNTHTSNNPKMRKKNGVAIRANSTAAIPRLSLAKSSRRAFKRG